MTDVSGSMNDPRMDSARHQVGQLMSLWGNMGVDFGRVTSMCFTEEDQKYLPLVQEAITEGLALTVAAQNEAGKLRETAEGAIAAIEALDVDCDVDVIIDSLPNGD